MYVLLLLSGFICLQLGWAQILAGDCVCIQGSAVNVRDLPCGNELKTHSYGACFEATGESVTCDLSGTSHNFVEFIYNGAMSGWTAENYLSVSAAEKCDSVGEACMPIVSRTEWGARPPSGTTKLSPPLSGVFVHHSAGSHCYTSEDCEAQVRAIQDYHMDGQGWNDIGYNFLIGEDGRIYEGRGWDNQGAHARMHNSWSYGVCVIGDFSFGLPNEAAQKALKSVMQCGADEGNLTPGHEIFGHRDGVCTACPGDNLYNLISTWPYFSTRDIPVDCLSEKFN